MELLKKVMSKIIILLIFSLFHNTIYSYQLKFVKGLNKLSNYNELKDIQVKDVQEKKGNNTTLKRKNGIVYKENESIPYEGALITRDMKNNIIGVYFYENGKNERIAYDYYENGQLEMDAPQRNDKTEGSATQYYKNGKLRCKLQVKNEIIVHSKCYTEKGELLQIYDGDINRSGILTKYYEGLEVKAFIAEVNQNYTSNATEYIKNGRTLV